MNRSVPSGAASAVFLPCFKSLLPAVLLAPLAALWGGSAAAVTLDLDRTAPADLYAYPSQAVLAWTAAAQKTYRVQSADALSATTVWTTEEPVRFEVAGPVQWMAPEGLVQKKYYRLALPEPEVQTLEPAFIDSGDTNALLYIVGQCLPSNGTVVINGQSFTPVAADSNATWLAISLNSLSPGVPVTGSVLVLDAGSNTVAELPVEYPVLYGATFSWRQLQGPPTEPPASPRCAYLSRKGYLAYKAGSNPAVADALSKKGYEYYQARPDSPAARAGGVCDGKDDDCDGFVDELALSEATGEIRIQETDLSIPGRGLDFAWTRTYRSRTGPDTAQGAGWDFSYNASVTQQLDGTVEVCFGDGRCDTFHPDGTNGWFRDEHVVKVGDLNGDGMPDVLFADTGRWLFNPAAGSPAPGKLWQIIDRSGNTMTLDYDVTGRLTSVVDTLGRTNTVAYNPAGLIESVADFSGRTVQFLYDGNGDLTACVSPAVTGTPDGNDFPGGKTNQYAYSGGFADPRLNHNLTACTDPLGQTWLQVTYFTNQNPVSVAFDSVASVQRGADTMDLWRGMIRATPDNGYAVLHCIENDFVGNVCETYYDARLRPVRVVEFTGRADPALPTTPSVNRPAGKLRLDDPDFFETRFEWNPDSLCTRIDHPAGNTTEWIYERVFNQDAGHSNRLHDADLRILRERPCCDNDDDGDGVPDTVDWRFVYDPRFGSPPVLRGISGRGTVATGRIETGMVSGDRKGWDGTIKGTAFDGDVPPMIGSSAKIRNRGWDGTIKGSLKRTGGPVVADMDRDGLPDLAVRRIEPNGNVTTAEYDGEGNLLRLDRLGPANGGVEAAGSSFAYNAHGQLTAATNATDAAGRETYDVYLYGEVPGAAGYGYLIESIVDAGPTGLALSIQYDYDALGRVTQAVDARGITNSYTYNALGQCVRATAPGYGGGGGGGSGGTVARYAYDANDNVVQMDYDNLDETGTLDPANPLWTTQYAYDALDRCREVAQEVEQGVGFTTAISNLFFYDGNDNLAAVHTPLAAAGVDPDNLFTNLYDERDLPYRITAAPGAPDQSTVQFDYDANRNLVRYRAGPEEAGGEGVTSYAYDGFDRRVSVRDAFGNAVLHTYDRNGNLVREVTEGELVDVPGTNSNVTLAETRYTYDGLDRCVTRIDSFFDLSTGVNVGDGARTTTFAFAPIGQCKTVTDDNGHTTTYAYDTAGRLASVTNARGDVVSYTYDGNDNVVSLTRTDQSDLTPGAQQYVVDLAYDSLDRCVLSVDNAGNTNLYGYDSRGYVVSHLDPRENETFRVYDGLGRCVATTNYEGKARGITINTSHVEYNVNSLPTVVADANTNTTTYLYDSLNRCVTVIEADGTACGLVWSPRSNLVRIEDANGTVITNIFDTLDRCVYRDVVPAPGVATTTTFEVFAYDGLSRLVVASNDASRVELAYDSFGRCVEQEQDGLVSSYVYDAVGNRLAADYPSGRVVSYTYDALDQVASVGSGSGGLPPAAVATFAYDGAGRLGGVTRANGINTRVQWDGLVSPPNAAGDHGWRQVSGVNHQVGGGGAVIDQRVAAYDRAQNRVSRTQTVPFVGGASVITNLMDYDAVDRMVTFTRAAGAPDDLFMQHVLDPVGNRQLTFTNGFAGFYVMDATLPEPADFQMNQYTLTPFVAAPEQYDLNGSLVARLTAAGTQLEFYYDYADRLVDVVDLSSGVPSSLASYDYDALGRRIAKTVHPPAAPATRTTRFVHDHPDQDCDGLIIEEWENGLLARAYVRPEIDDEVLVTFDGGGAPLYHHHDDLGNTLALSDALGAVVERYDYDDFGAPRFLTADGLPTGAGASSLTNRFLFHGMEWDAETGFYLGHSQGSTTGPVDPKTGRAAVRGKVKSIKDFGNKLMNEPAAIRGKVKSIKDNGNGQTTGEVAVRGKVKVVRDTGSGFADGNPWSLKKEEGGRHTPFHNKYRPNFAYADAGRARATHKQDTYVWKLTTRKAPVSHSTHPVIHRDLAGSNVLAAPGGAIDGGTGSGGGFGTVAFTKAREAGGKARGINQGVVKSNTSIDGPSGGSTGGGNPAPGTGAIVGAIGGVVSAAAGAIGP